MSTLMYLYNIGTIFLYIQTCLLEVLFIVKYAHSDCLNSAK